MVYLAGIELDRARLSGSTRNGDFRGVKVLECTPGRGFICEEVRRGMHIIMRSIIVRKGTGGLWVWCAQRAVHCPGST